VERLGILGGTFDPPHLAHLTLARTAYEQLDLDLVLWAPAGQPPHKRRPSPAENAHTPIPADQYIPSPAQHRLAMTRLTIADHPHFAFCQLDLDRPGPHYTADLLALLAQEYGPETSFWFLVGEDSLRDLGKWHQPDRILSACRLAVYRRSGPPIEWDTLEGLVPGIRSQIDWLDNAPIDLSSTEIRQRVRSGLPVRHQVVAAVDDYIQQHQLYRS
jgi:nicotinate-nucleotide adenylyltransferase